ncbi:MAG: 2-amino-4-hydroxy-6-hydroxymethyldihydropteridine diphosphokinase [Candidatus Dadabacteria bacterium]|nr:MAG: 2-amino-4-hydroxy-6-hydroxymethyldihydropteridine diphosphokinase [Candidatus Dadabacteria bacterium]
MEVFEAILALGANLGNPEDTFKKALKFIERDIGEILAVSRYYITAPLNPPDIKEQNDFLNAALSCRTSLPPKKLLTTVLDIEEKLGRKREESVKWGPRVIDIDIISIDNLIINEPGLSVPHPELHHRDFVLVPLKEIKPDFIHPELGLTVDEMLDALNKQGSQLFVKKSLSR